MFGKPGAPCHLTVGKLIETHKGLAATWNWLVEFVANLKGEDGVEIDTTIPDHPILRGSSTKLISAEDSNVVITEGDGKETIIGVYYL